MRNIYVNFTRYVLALMVAATGALLIGEQVPADGAAPVAVRAAPDPHPGPHPLAYPACRHKVRNYAMAMKHGTPVAGLEFFWMKDTFPLPTQIWVRQVTQAIYVFCPRKGKPNKVMFARFIECQYFEGAQDHANWDSTQIKVIVRRKKPYATINNPPYHDIADNGKGEVQSCTEQSIRPENRHWISQGSVPIVEGHATVRLLHRPDQTKAYGKHRPSVRRDMPVSGAYRQHPPRL